MTKAMQPLDMIDHPGPGGFLVFCGVDGTGKSTIVDLTCKELTRRGRPVEILKQPSPFIRDFPPFRDSVAARNRERLHYPALSMIVQADRVQLSAKVIGPAMDAGRTVISDRYVLSGLSRLILSGETETDWFHASSRLLIRPTRTFLLHADPDVIRERLDARTFETTSALQFDEILTLQKIMLDLADIMDVVTVDTSSIRPEEAAAEVFRHLPETGADPEDSLCNTITLQPDPML